MRRAFTLVELVIVVIVIVVLIAIALPVIKYNVEAARLREGARQVNGMFASAKAHAAATGRPAGVWLELEQVTPGLTQCTQLYLAEVPAAYAGDVQNATCKVEIGKTGTPADNAPWSIDFQGTAAMLPALVAVGETFHIRLDHKGQWYMARRTAAGFEILQTGSTRPPRLPRFGPDKLPGVAGVDDDGNGVIDFVDLNGDGLPNGIDTDGDGVLDTPDRWDETEVLWPGSDDDNQPQTYEIRRQPQRSGQPLDLPLGIVIDPNYSGAGSTGNQFANAAKRLLVMFNPTGDIASVSYIDQTTGALVEDVGTSKLFLLIGRTERLELPWSNVPQSNIADGGNLWVTVNRRNGSVGTIENVPNVALPIGTAAERAAYLETSREFARTGEVKGGQ